MNADLPVSRVLDDESLTGDLEEAAGEILVGWAVKQAERIAASARNKDAAFKELDTACRQARAAGRVVTMVCQQHDLTGAAALANQEGFSWPLGAAGSEAAAMQWLLDHLAHGR